MIDLAVVEEYGVRLQTGEPVTLRVMRRPGAAPSPTRRDPYQQRLEPAGIYVLHAGGQHLPPGWVAGTAELRSPLVVLFSADGSGRYNQASWKAHLARAYGATGAALTSALRAQGHDAVVTAVALRGDLVSSEIVILDPAAVAWRPPC